MHRFVFSIFLCFAAIAPFLNCGVLADVVTCSGIVPMRYRNDMISIMDFGGVGDGVTMNTKAFRAAIYRIEHLRRRGGTVLYIPPGEYLTESFNLTSHMTLYLARGAVIKATQDTRYWPLIAPLPSYGRGRERPGGRYMSFIHGDGLHDVIITGENGTIDGKGRSHEGEIRYGFSIVKGKANHPVEDYHVATFIQMQEHELGLFAIFDGHLGDGVPAYLQKFLFSNILKEEEFWTDPRRSISNAYEKTDQAILSQSSNLGRGGSTAVTAILINGQRLLVANVGDSRAVLSRGGQAIQMTTDHEPNTERGSIENKGGFVSNVPGDVPRVNGQLAVSRAFGDKSLKSHLRSDPDIQDTIIDFNTDVLILASDGLWKVMENQEAVDIARRMRDPRKAAKQLIAEALERDSEDDISCIVVRFRG